MVNDHELPPNRQPYGAECAAAAHTNTARAPTESMSTALSGCYAPRANG